MASQIGFRYTDPYNLAFLRFFIATAVILLLMIPFEKSLGVIQQLRRKWIWFIGIIYGIAFVLQYAGQSLTSASEATLLTNLDPILIPPIAIVLLKDRITKAQMVAIVLGLTGLFLVASPRVGLGTMELVGDVLLFLTSVTYALFTVFTKKIGVSAIGGSFALIIVVTLVCFPVALALGDINPTHLSMGLVGWGATFYLSTACTIIAVTLYLRGLKSVKASEAGVLFLVQVLEGLILSALLLGEFLSVTQTVGAAAILLALAFGVRFR